MKPGIPIGMMNFDRSSTRHDEYCQWLVDVKKVPSDRAEDIVEELREQLGQHSYKTETVLPREMRMFGYIIGSPLDSTR